MLAKKAKAVQLQPVVDFFASRKVGEILSHQGLFPSLNPEVDNRIDTDKPFLWPGWDFIRENDISDLIAHCERVFSTPRSKGRKNESDNHLRAALFRQNRGHS